MHTHWVTISKPLPATGSYRSQEQRRIRCSGPLQFSLVPYTVRRRFRRQGGTIARRAIALDFFCPGWPLQHLVPIPPRHQHIYPKTDGQGSRKSDMELQQGRRSFQHKCARSGDALYAGLVITLLIGKSLSIIPTVCSDCLLLPFRSYIGAKMLQFCIACTNWGDQTSRVIYLLLCQVTLFKVSVFGEVTVWLIREGRLH